MIRGARESEITVGDKVFLAQNVRQKGDPTFAEHRYTVLARDGAKVVVQSDRGVQYSRNVQDVKKVPIGLQEEDYEEEEENTISPDIHFPDGEPPEQSEITGRPKRSTKKPSKFTDMVLYSIYD